MAPATRPVVEEAAGPEPRTAEPSGNGRPETGTAGAAAGVDRGLRVRARRAGEAVGATDETAPDATAATTPTPTAATTPTPTPTERPGASPDAAERVEARRARAAQRTSPPVQFRSGASAPVRTDGDRSRPEPSESGDDGVDANGAARPRRRRQLRAR